jgi:hypothetical protein
MMAVSHDQQQWFEEGWDPFVIRARGACWIPVFRPLARFSVIPGIPAIMDIPGTQVRAGGLTDWLLSKAELAHKRAVARDVFAVKVVEQTATLTDQLQQPAPGAVVVRVLAQVLR